MSPFADRPFCCSRKPTINPIPTPTKVNVTSRFCFTHPKHECRQELALSLTVLPSTFTMLTLCPILPHLSGMSQPFFFIFALNFELFLFLLACLLNMLALICDHFPGSYHLIPAQVYIIFLDSLLLQNINQRNNIYQYNNSYTLYNRTKSKGI